MQSEEDWDDGDDWDEEYDDSDSSSILDMELGTKLKLAGVFGVVILIIMSSMIFTNFGFYSGAGTVSVLIDVEESLNPEDRTRWCPRPCAARPTESSLGSWVESPDNGPGVPADQRRICCRPRPLAVCSRQSGFDFAMDDLRYFHLRNADEPSSKLFLLWKPGSSTRRCH